MNNQLSLSVLNQSRRFQLFGAREAIRWEYIVIKDTKIVNKSC